MNIIEIQPDLNTADVFQFLGDQGRPQQYSHALQQKVRIWKIKAKTLLTPRLLYSVNKIGHISNESVEIHRSCRFKSPILSKALRTSDEIVCFAATVGDRIEKEIRHLFKQHRLVDAVVLDAVGSAAVENLVDQFHETINQHITNGPEKAVTARFSPGYCDWPVSQQKELFKLIDSKLIGVVLNDACLMAPRKSISGIFGIYCVSENRRNPFIPCLDCRKTDCPDRRYFYERGYDSKCSI